ncbi:MAG: hypothetical protein A3E87_03535 [Gammaproteobacteria bacterium RIFCSPHIGHO2_12_FULL_35_23]|nr:MAG: hypothetical protein A3E87_03535 [Gammaproteobacteria bacterium RIFCSPHIGHO2_12_FULL_35_23]
MKIPFYHVDAFAAGPFMGNPATVCLLPKWLDEATLQAIAAEFNLRATAFVVKSAASHYEIRWFDAHSEKSSCGHATLAAAHILLNELKIEQNIIKFVNFTNEITVNKQGAEISLTAKAIEMRFSPAPKLLSQTLNIIVKEAYQTNEQTILIIDDPQRIKELTPSFHKLVDFDKRAFIVTAASKKADFVFRYFTPNAIFKEDPITGTALYILTPYWAKKLNKQKLLAEQLSARGNLIPTEFNKNLVTIKGQAYLFAEGKFNIPD